MVRTIRKMQNNNKILIYSNKKKTALNLLQFESRFANLQGSVPMSQADGHEIQIKIIVKQQTTFNCDHFLKYSS